MTYFRWKCAQCGAVGRVRNSGLPVTSLINRAAIQHKMAHPDCPVAGDAEVTLSPGACTFSKHPPMQVLDIDARVSELLKSNVPCDELDLLESGSGQTQIPNVPKPPVRDETTTRSETERPNE